jgi:membrane protein required for colicin V production
VNLLDILLAVIVGGSVIAGFRAGFARAAIGFLAVIGGILIAFWFYGIPASWVHSVVDNTTVSNVAGFLMVFSAVQIAGTLASLTLSKFFKWTGLSFLDRIFGAGFGLVRGMMMATGFIAILMAFIPTPNPAWMVNSQVLPYVADASNFITGLAPRAVKDAFNNSLTEIRKDWDDQVKRARQYHDKAGKSKLKPVEQ